jgi:hypothetical protein
MGRSNKEAQPIISPTTLGPLLQPNTQQRNLDRALQSEVPNAPAAPNTSPQEGTEG